VTPSRPLTDALDVALSGLVTVVSPLVVAGALLIGGVVLARTRSTPAALGVVLDLFLVVGLLRLSASASWQAILTAAAIVVIRKLVTLGLARGRAALARSRLQPEPR
jgi:hypothetical protein